MRSWKRERERERVERVHDDDDRLCIELSSLGLEGIIGSPMIQVMTETRDDKRQTLQRTH